LYWKNICGKWNEEEEIEDDKIRGKLLCVIGVFYNSSECSLGAAQQCFEIALSYTKERKQFNQSIYFIISKCSIQISRYGR
jgi:hypothetical protein